MPFGRWLAAAAADGLGRIFVIGGFDGNTPINSVVSYSIDSGEWRAEAPMPTPRALCGAVLYGGRIYVLGGRSMEPFLPNPFQPVRSSRKCPKLPHVTSVRRLPFPSSLFCC
jgi:hypothetical protein